MVEIPGAPITEAEDEDRFHAIKLEGLAVHHDVLLTELQNIADGKLKRLMVFMPPGSAKSTYCSVVFPAWLMGVHDRTQVILGCYGSDLARKQGRRARQLVRSSGYQALFDAEITKESSAADEWSMTNSSEYMAGGILAGMTGNRANGIIVDDPVKGREDAESETIRRKTANAFQDDLLTRLKPGGWVIIVQTRWHQDDLAGGILPEDWNGESGDILCRDGQTWRVICIPAKADRADDPLGRSVGEYLWPEWFPKEHWKPFETNTRTWSSLYQGKPSPEEGTLFQREWFHRHESMLPAQVKNRHIYITSDFAVTDGGGDFTEIGVWGYGSGNTLAQLDWWHGQKDTAEWINNALMLIRRWKPLCFFGEKGVIEKAIRPALVREMREQTTNCRLEWIPSVTNKVIRARPFQSMASMRKVSLLKDDRGDRVLDQLLRFPGGKYDDAVDVCTLMGSVIDEAHPAVAPPPVKEKTRDAWASDLKDDDDSDDVDWKAA